MEILIVEDETAVADQLRDLLFKEGYRCDVAYNFKDALEAVDAKRYDLVLLDWNLPDGDGLYLLELLREEENPVPVLMLSAKSAVDDRVKVLDAGGDDYLCKPFSNLELLARIRALLRREAPVKRSKLRVADIELDTVTREVYVNKTPIKLSPTEYELLELLMRNKNVVLTRYQLNDHLCKEYSTLKQSNFVDVHIKNLRKKLGRNDYIVTVRGVGYKMGG